MKEFVLNNWYYIFYCVCMLTTLIVSIVSFIKAKKNAKTATQIADIKVKATNTFKNCVNEFIKDAEAFKNYSGAEKKNYVMTRAIQLASGLMSNEEIDEYIETQVALTDAVNKHNH